MLGRGMEVGTVKAPQDGKLPSDHFRGGPLLMQRGISFMGLGSRGAGHGRPVCCAIGFPRPPLMGGSGERFQPSRLAACQMRDSLKFTWSVLRANFAVSARVSMTSLRAPRKDTSWYSTLCRFAKAFTRGFSFRKW